ncbi:MAG TPA: hypothetical protein QF905_06885, partial [Acidimicrobiales bacterium]|nr:hypothetical protein [Acidimicrobiales bacterium]
RPGLGTAPRGCRRWGGGAALAGGNLAAVPHPGRGSVDGHPEQASVSVVQASPIARLGTTLPVDMAAT